MMIAVELGSTGEEEISLFQRLSEGNGRKPLRLAPWPVDIWEQLEVCVDPFTWKLRAEDVEPPGSGFSTATVKVPAEAAFPVAVSCVEETKVVVSVLPERSTLAPFTKPEPVRVREKLPRLVELGEMPEREGVGLRSVTEEDADLVVSAALVAVTETVFGEGRVAGAV